MISIRNKTRSNQQIPEWVQVSGCADDIYGTLLGICPVTGNAVSLPENDTPEIIVTFGCAGSGKTRSFLIPQMYQCIKREESAIVTDTDGYLYRCMSKIFVENGYNVGVFNASDPYPHDVKEISEKVSRTLSCGKNIYFAIRSVYDARSDSVLSSFVRNILKMSVGAYGKRAINFLLDDFSRIEPAPEFANILQADNTANGKYRIFIILQNIKQLRGKYPGATGRDPLAKSCTKLFFGGNCDRETADFVCQHIAGEGRLDVDSLIKQDASNLIAIKNEQTPVVLKKINPDIFFKPEKKTGKRTGMSRYLLTGDMSPHWK